MLKYFATLFLFVGLLSAGSLEISPKAPPPPKRVLWKIGVAALAVAQGLDIASSWRQREANSMIRSPSGLFDAKAAAIKSGIMLGTAATQRAAVRKSRRAEKLLTCASFLASAITAAVAAHNFEIRGRSTAPSQ